MVTDDGYEVIVSIETEERMKTKVSISSKGRSRPTRRDVEEREDKTHVREAEEEGESIEAGDYRKAVWGVGGQ